MEAHFFRRFCAELAPLLAGARVEKVYRPSADVTTFVLYTTGRKQNLLLRAGRRFPLLFLSDQRPANPDNPDGLSMLLRKHLRGRRLGSVVVDWTTRRLAFPVIGGDWLLLDLREGPSLISTLPDGFGEELLWPEPASFDAVLSSKDVWEKYPQFTPPLRKILTELDALDAQALLVDLEMPPVVYENDEEPGDVYVYFQEGVPVQTFVWSLLPVLRGTWEERVVPSAMQAATMLGEAQLFTDISHSEQTALAIPLQAARKKVRKTLKKLDAEEQRLQGMIEQQKNAVALQASLWNLDVNSRVQEVVVPDPYGESVDIAISLDPLKTIRENMEYFFKQAKRGKRGLDMLAQRRVSIAEELVKLEKGELTPPPVQQKVRQLPTKRQARTQANDKLIHTFRSSDGFLLLRGRSSKGNHEILNRASAHDYWFHAEDGPSAHVILRLDYPGQSVPERTMQEAAILVGVKSWQREDRQARIFCALVKEVRKIKGASHGKVRVGKIIQSLLVSLDSSLEETLRSAL